MFPNRLGHQKKKETTQQKTNKEKLRKKMGTIVPTMNHYPRNGQEEDSEFSTR